MDNFKKLTKLIVYVKQKVPDNTSLDC